jgi:signal transduction histidine kinase
LRRAIGNLVDNALKYGEPGRDVTVTVARLEHHVAISVHNDGNPLGPDDLEKIFQPHQRLSRDRAKPGRGLGLSLVKSVAEAHGGEIRALSNADHGTEFVLTLPLDLPLGRLVDELPRQSA